MTEHSPTAIRLNIVSEVALEGGQPRPIHMFRPGTFVDMNGRETSFSLDDVSTIVSRFSKRRKLPITERHDFGQAIGRLQDVWADAEGNLFGLPKWNAKGKSLLEDEIYDGFSCELDRDGDGWTLIGGSLTNYPAVGGLEPVTLQAPPLVSRMEETRVEDVPTVSLPQPPIEPMAPPAPTPARPDISSITQEHTPMSDIQEPVTQFAAMPVITDPSVQAQLDSFLAQAQAQMEAQKQAMYAQIKADFERKTLEAQQMNTITTFARNATTTSPTQPYALACPADELSQLLLETPSAVRVKWMALLNRVTSGNGVVSFDEIGSSGSGADTDTWNALVAAEQATGLSRVQAIQSAARKHPELYAAQSAPKKGGR